MLRFPFAVASTIVAFSASAFVARAETLQIFLLFGQSNMEGQAYTYDNANTAGWNIPTMEFLLSGTPAATNYLSNMPFGFKGSLNSGWLDPRSSAGGKGSRPKRFLRPGVDQR